MTKKNALKYLLKEYINGKYRMDTFCDEFERIYYYVENDNDILNATENEIMKSLADVCGRYSPYDEDKKNFPDVYFSEDIVNEHIMKSIKLLGI